MQENPSPAAPARRNHSSMSTPRTALSYTSRLILRPAARRTVASGICRPPPKQQPQSRHIAYNQNSLFESKNHSVSQPRPPTGKLRILIDPLPPFKHKIRPHALFFQSLGDLRAISTSKLLSERTLYNLIPLGNRSARSNRAANPAQVNCVIPLFTLQLFCRKNSGMVEAA
jgi:hypothetical protein